MMTSSVDHRTLMSSDGRKVVHEDYSSPLDYQNSDVLSEHHFQDGEDDSSSYLTSSTPTGRPLPLEIPWLYLQLVYEIYSGSTAMIMGNMLEWLDFGIYGYSEQEISQVLFSNNVTAGWATFGLGYAFRPIGAYVLGRLADATSRHHSFLIAILGMAFSTAGLALLPAVCANGQQAIDHSDGNDFWLSSYCVNAVWKTAGPAIALRCVQGFSAGAAAGGVNVIQSEEWSRKLPQALAQSVGVNNVSGAAASILSAVIVFGLRAWLGEEAYAAYGWRLAFVIVIPPSAIATCLLTTSHKPSEEDSEFVASSCLKHQHEYELSTQNFTDQDQDENDDDVVNDPLNHDGEHAFQDEPTRTSLTNDGVPQNAMPIVGSDRFAMDSNVQVSLSKLIALSIYIQFAIASYNNLNIYMVQYARPNYHVSSETATLMALAGKSIQLFMTPLAAGLADIYGWYGVCGVSGIGCALLAVPLMAAANTNADSTTIIWILVSGILPMISTPWILNAPLLATSIFPTHRRSEGTSLVMAMGTALAGFFPLFLNQIELDLAENAAYGCGTVLAVVAAVAAFAILWIRRRALHGHVVIYQRPYLF